MPTSTTTLSDGSYVQVTETDDQQHVLIDHYSSSGALLNARRIDGMAYDFPTITPTTDAGYVLDLTSQQHATTVTIEKVSSDETIYRTAPLNAPLMAQLSSAVIATAGGGFVVTTNEPGSPGKDAGFEAFGATGQLQQRANLDGYGLSAVAEQGGGYVLNWTAFDGTSRSLTVDATHAPDLAAPAAPQIVGYDHTTGQTFQSGSQTNDPHPTIELRVTSDEVGDAITNGPGGFSHVITQADVAQGTLTLPDATPGNDLYRLDKPDGVTVSTTFSYYYSGSGGSGGGSSGQTYTSPGPGSTESGGPGNDTFYPSQGNDTLTGGGGSNDYIFRQQPWSPDTITDFKVGTDKLDLSALFSQYGYTGSDPAADGWIYLYSDGNGGTIVRFQDHTGAHEYPNTIIDLKGVSPTGLTWAELSGQAASGSGGSTTGQTYTSPGPGSTETGGPGNDTFYPSQGNDTLTGGGGSNDYVFNPQPWAPDTITNFKVGTDKLDLSALFTQYGYTGSDPVADGWIYLYGDGNGGTIVRFQDHTGAHEYPNTIIDLKGVSPTGLTWAELSGQAAAGSGGSTPGQTYTSPGPGSTETGGPGDDTFYPSQGNDVLTGGGGANTYTFNQQPWSPDTITDFHPGTDHINLQPLFRQYGYTGSNPVADGWVAVYDDGHGGVIVRFQDHTGTFQYGNTIIDLQHVTAAQLTASDWLTH